MTVQSLSLNIKIAPLGKDIFMAATNVGGLPVRGRSAKDEATAVRNLFYELQNDSNDDVTIAVSLAATGQTFESVMGELPTTAANE
jgi:hypothetical protein